MTRHLLKYSQKIGDLLNQLLISNFSRIEQITYKNETVGSLIFLLHFINSSKNVSMKKISEYLRVPPSTTTRKVDRLEKLNLIKRVISKTDRRGFDLRLTNQGKEFYKTVFNSKLEEFHAQLARFSEEELQITIKILSTIINSQKC